MTITRQEIAAQSARRMLSRFSAAASELGVADLARYTVRVNRTGVQSGWCRDGLDVRTAVTTVTAETEQATAEGYAVEFQVSVQFPTFRIAADGDVSVR